MVKRVPAISIVIPLYNKGKYIARALNSVFSQTFTNFEVIVVDDGSTDDGPDIVHNYNDSRLRLIQQENQGPGAARNRGVKESNAKYVAFLDADDEWFPEYLNSSYEILQNNPECDVCVSRFVTDDGLKLHDCRDSVNYVDWIGVHEIRNGISDNDLENIIGRFRTPVVFTKKETVDRYGGFHKEIYFGEDWYFWIVLLMNCKINYVDKSLVKINSKDSGIGSQGLISNPIQAYYLDANTIREKCPVEKKGLLERFLAIHALRHAHVRAGVGNFEVANYLVRNFPMMKNVNFISYLFLRAKLLLPGPYRLFQKIFRKNNLQSNVKW